MPDLEHVGRARWSLRLELICVVTTGSVKPAGGACRRGTFGSGNYDRVKIRFHGAHAGLESTIRRRTE